MSSNDASNTSGFDSDPEEHIDWEMLSAFSDNESSSRSESSSGSEGSYSLIPSESDHEPPESEAESGRSLDLASLESEIHRIEEDIVRRHGPPEVPAEFEIDRENDEWILARRRMALMDRERQSIDSYTPPPTVERVAKSQPSDSGWVANFSSLFHTAPLPHFPHSMPGVGTRQRLDEGGHRGISLKQMPEPLMPELGPPQIFHGDQISAARLASPAKPTTLRVPAKIAHRRQQQTQPIPVRTTNRPIRPAVSRSQEQDLAPNTEHKVCLRCGRIQPEWDSSPPRPLTESCAHPQGLCNPCISYKINTSVSHWGRAWNQITCPECPQLLDFPTVLHFVPQYLRERLETQSLLSVLSTDPNFIECTAAGCHSGQIHEGGSAQPIVTCVSCGHKICFNHKQEWHAGVTCAEIDGAAGGPLPSRNEEQVFPAGITDKGDQDAVVTNKKISETTSPAQATDDKTMEAHKIHKPCPKCNERLVEDIDTRPYNTCQC